MRPDGGGITRLAPLLLASLLLHLAVIGVIVAKHRRGPDNHVRSPMKIEYVEVVAHHERVRQAPAPPPIPAAAPRALPAPVSRPATPQKRGVPETVAAPPPGPPSPSPAKTTAGGATITAITPLTSSEIGSVPVSRRNNGAGPESGAGTASGHHAGPAGQPALAPSPGEAAAAQNRRTAYQAQVKRLIEAHKEYPLAARRSRLEGNCLRRFILNRGGSLVGEVERLSSCGHAFLDEAATRAISAVGTFPPPPDTAKNGEATITVTITFKLNTSREER